MKKIFSVLVVIFLVVSMFCSVQLNVFATEYISNVEQNTEDRENGIEEFLAENANEQKSKEENVKQYLEEKEKQSIERKKQEEKLAKEQKGEQEKANKIFRYICIFNVISSLCILLISIKSKLPKSYMLLPLFFSIFGLIGFVVACINRKKGMAEIE